MGSVTQRDLARRLGVSRSTIAAAFANQPRVHPETRKRVLSAAERLGYRPDRYARAMRTGKSGLIGMIVCEGITQMSAMRAWHVAQAIQRAGYQPLSSDAGWFPDGAQAACREVLDAHVEGVVLLSPTCDFEPIRRAKVPMVGIAGLRLPGVPQVRANVRQGMYDLTNHLLALGYRRLSLLTQWPLGELDESQCWYVKERMDGFRAAARAARLDASDAEVVLEDFVSDLTQPYLTGKVAMTNLLKRPRRPEAVLCSNDDWAMGALTACTEAGLRVPDDIAVTGFDDSPASGFGAVPLTTVAQPLEQMAAEAVRLLLRRMQRKETGTRDRLVKVPCRVVVRRSCGAMLRGGLVGVESRMR
jgi:LacI family transcriptional regulator